MRIIDRSIMRVNRFQQRHAWAGFPYAVIKKYGDDQAGYQGALVTYYAFLSLFPLLIVATSGLQLLFKKNAHLRARLLLSITHYFPIIGNELQNNLHGRGRTGITLLLGAVVALYGARGVADVSRNTFNNFWRVPKHERAGFFPATVQSLSMILIGGVGLFVTGFLSSYATSLGHGVAIKVLSTGISLVILVAVFFCIFKIGTSSNVVTRKDAQLAAVLAAIGVQILQSFGGYLITHELKNLNTLYGAFSLVLCLLFWLYLQVEVVLYAVEATTVAQFQLWPRSLTSELTSQDKRAYQLHAEEQSLRLPRKRRA